VYKSPSFSIVTTSRRSTYIVMRRERHGDVKVRDAIRLIEQDGWHSVKPGTVTVAGKLGVDVPIGTLNSILKQAGLKPP
jgi:predicted RNA binding protein YcfA (HicA-like mRNA interferase family)